MKITQEIIIDKPITDCWEVLGNQYTELHRWASPVNHAEGDGKVGLNGASCDIRGCNVSGMGDITEKLTDFDPENHFLSYEVITGLPKMMEVAKNSWCLTAVSPNRTKLKMNGFIELNGFLANLMKPMIKIQFKSMTKNIVEEFKYYVETGKPHPRKIKSSKKFKHKSTFKIIVLGVSAICIALPLQSCKIADLRTSNIDTTKPNREQKALTILDKVIEKHGLKALAKAETYSLQATDNWKGIMAMMNPLPKDNELMELRYRPLSFDGQFNYLNSNNKTTYGIQSLKSYKIDENGNVKFNNKEKITFTLAAIQYFIELPLRLKNAPIVKYAGIKEFEGQSYDLIFATWERIEPHKEHDQYLLYVNRETGYLSFVNYTVRGMYLPMPKNIYGSLRLTDLKENVDGIIYPGTLYIQLNKLKNAERSAHTMVLSAIELNTFELETLYPDENLEYKGDSKN